MQNGLKKIDNASANIPTLTQDVTYTEFNKVKTITEGDNSISINYGPDYERKKQTSVFTGQLAQNQKVFVKYYSGAPQLLGMLLMLMGGMESF